MRFKKAFPQTVSPSLSHTTSMFILPIYPNSLFLPPLYVCLPLILPLSAANIPFHIYPPPPLSSFFSLSRPYPPFSPDSLLHVFLLRPFPLHLSYSFLHRLSVRHSQECREECSEHVRSPKVPPGSGEQRRVVLLLAVRVVESRRHRPVPVLHLPRWPGHPGLSWPGAEQSGYDTINNFLPFFFFSTPRGKDWCPKIKKWPSFSFQQML